MVEPLGLGKIPKVSFFLETNHFIGGMITQLSPQEHFFLRFRNAGPSAGMGEGEHLFISLLFEYSLPLSAPSKSGVILIIS